MNSQKPVITSSTNNNRRSSKSRRRREEYVINNLRNSWRVFLSKIGEAHKAAKRADATAKKSYAQGYVKNQDVEICVNEIAKHKEDLRSQLTKVEASLRGNAKEMQALHLFYRSSGAVGRRSKRRRRVVGSKI